MATISPGVVTPVNVESGSTKFWGPNSAQTYSGTAYSGTFIPTLWSGKLAKKFYETAIFPAIANTDWQGEIAGMGDSVVINSIPDVTVREYKIGNNLTYETPGPKTIELKIDEGNYFGINVPDVLEHQAKPNLMNMFTTEAAYQMKKYVDHRGMLKVLFSTTTGMLAKDASGSENFGLISHKNCTVQDTSSSTPVYAGAESAAFNTGSDFSAVSLTSSNIIALITKMSSVLDEANVPEEGRYLVISPLERQLLLESNIAQAYLTGDATSPLRNGKIGRIDRFDVYVCNHMPRAAADKSWVRYTPSGGSETDVLSGAVKRHLILAGTKAGISFASQISKVESLQNPSDFGNLVRGLNVWGARVTQGQALVPAIIAG